ncbi:zinc finger CCCH domain-containing protein 9-like [Wolffia australiana]
MAGNGTDILIRSKKDETDDGMVDKSMTMEVGRPKHFFTLSCSLADRDDAASDYEDFRPSRCMKFRELRPARTTNQSFHEMQTESDFNNGNTISDSLVSCSQPLLPITVKQESFNICDSLFSPTASASFLPQFHYQMVPYEDGTEKATATEQIFSLARLTLLHEQMLARCQLCLSHLEEAADEAEALRLENSNLRLANVELARHLTIISSYGVGAATCPPEIYTGLPVDLVNDFQRLDLIGSPSSSDCQNYYFPAKRSPVQDQRVNLPKSISIRSKGYMKLSGGNRNSRFRYSDPTVLGPQKVYVPLDEDKEREKATLEFEAYAQGMFKTELCNKWQETGACPYGEHCQFAHGIAELRPVIRHPRYKTELCRMILSGGSCPYGHRCHFRHAIAPQDKFLLQ